MPQCLLDKLPHLLLPFLNVDERAGQRRRKGQEGKGKVCAVVLLSIGLFQKSSQNKFL